MRRPPSLLRFASLIPTAALVALAALWACGGGGSGSGSGTPAPPPATPTLTSLTLAPAAPTLNVGSTVDLQATGHFSDGSTTVAYDSQVTWTSSAPAVTTVNAAGLVTAVAAGNATITAAKGGVQATVPVTVNLATRTLVGIDLNPTSMTLAMGQLRDIAASALWSDGTGSSGYNGSVIWTSSQPAVATVSTLGMVTPVAAGTTTITASASGKSATCAVTVTAATPILSSITLSPASATLSAGNTLNLAAVGHYSDGSTANIVPITTLVWSSSNTAAATVDNYGIVTGAGAGSSTISAAKDGKTGTAAITVSAAAPTFDSRLVGTWQWIGTPDASGNNFGSFYHLYANGTFTYDLIYQAGPSACIAFKLVVAHHEGTFGSQGSLDNAANPGKLVFSCTNHFTDYTNCSNNTSRTPWSGANPHFHWAAFSSGGLITNHSDDFNTTGNLLHLKQ